MKTLMTVLALVVLGGVAQAAPKKQAVKTELADEASIFDLTLEEKVTLKRVAMVLTALSDKEQANLLDTMVTMAKEKQVADSVAKANTLGNPFPEPAKPLPAPVLAPEFTRPMFRAMPLTSEIRKP